jgi:hypothetical protein
MYICFALAAVIMAALVAFSSWMVLEINRLPPIDDREEVAARLAGS